MNGRRDTPDWVVCATCRAIYAPSLLGAAVCPKCGDSHWDPAAIPDGDEPLESPLVTCAA